MTPGYYYNPKLPDSNLFFITGAISKEGYFEYHELDHHNQGYRTVCGPSSPRVLGAHLIQASTTCDFPAFLREHPELTMTDFKVGQVIRTRRYAVSPSRIGIITDVRSYTTALATIKMTIITPADVDKVMFNSDSILAYDSILLLDYVASVNDLINNYPEVFL